MKIYLVGGAVRDKLLGLTIKDRDWVVVGATPAEMESKGFQRVGKGFPVYLHPESHEEYALARTERKIGPGYKGFTTEFSPHVSLEEDLLRRDLTINSIAEDITGKIIDPYNGRLDLENRILRHVSPAFVEDPVRVLRVARFAARYANLGFTVAESTIDLMRAMVRNGEVDALVSERVWTELERVLAEDCPTEFFRVLKKCDALAKILPEIDCLFGIPQTKKHHPEVDTGEHVMMVLQQSTLLSDDTEIRFAALVHDLGKGVTPEHEWPKHKGHEDNGVPLVKAMCKRLAVPNTFRDLGVLVTQFHLHYHRLLELDGNTIYHVLQSLDAFRRPDRFYKYVLACEADSRGRLGYERKSCPQSALFRALFESASRIKGRELAAGGLVGLELKQELDCKRLEEINTCLHHYQESR